MALDITAEKKFQIGHGVVATFYRRNNNSIVVHLADNMEVKHATGTNHHTETIPLGWRPATEIHIECCLIIGDAFQPNRHLEYVFMPDGRIMTYSKGNETVPVHVVGTQTYMMHPKDIAEARNPKPVTKAKPKGPTLQKYEFRVGEEDLTTYIDTLINGAKGKIEVETISDHVVSGKIMGTFRSDKAVSGLHIGTIPKENTIGNQVLYPVLANELIRTKDAFIQINPDGRIYMMDADAGATYTFNITLPIIY